MIKILEFDKKEKAEICLNKINLMASMWWQSQGYTILNNNGVLELVGKVNDIDNLEAIRTISWDIVKESPQNTYYITSLTGHRDEWNNWKQNLKDNFNYDFDGIEKEFPAKWIIEEED